MKKTCYGCRALNVNRCSLNLKTDIIFKKMPFDRTVSEVVPIEECPKPRTYDKLLLLLKYKKS